MVDKYSKSHTIETFSQGEIVTIKLLQGTRTSTDNKRLYAQVISDPKLHRYLIQTTHGIINRLLPTKDLERVLLSIANSIDIQGLNQQILLLKACTRRVYK